MASSPCSVPSFRNTHEVIGAPSSDPTSTTLAMSSIFSNSSSSFCFSHVSLKSLALCSSDEHHRVRSPTKRPTTPFDKSALVPSMLLNRVVKHKHRGSGFLLNRPARFDPLPHVFRAVLVTSDECAGKCVKHNEHGPNRCNGSQKRAALRRIAKLHGLERKNTFEIFFSACSFCHAAIRFLMPLPPSPATYTTGPCFTECPSHGLPVAIETN